MSISRSFKSLLFKEKYYCTTYKLSFILNSPLPIYNKEEILNNTKLRNKVYRYSNSLYAHCNRFNFINLKLVAKDNRYFNRIIAHCLSNSIMFDNKHKFNCTLRRDDRLYAIFQNRDVKITCYCSFEQNNYKYKCDNHIVLIESSNITEFILNDIDYKHHIFHFNNNKLVSLEQRSTRMSDRENTFRNMTFYYSGRVKSITYPNNIVDNFYDNCNKRYKVKYLIDKFNYDYLKLDKYSKLLNFVFGDLVDDSITVKKQINDKLDKMNQFQLKMLLRNMT